MKKLLTFFACIALVACTKEPPIQTSINEQAFPGFVFNNNLSTGVSLNAYEYQATGDKKLNITSCDQALETSTETVADYEYFRFKLLQVSCHALNKLQQAKDSMHSYLPQKIGIEFYGQLPAAALPLLNKSEITQRSNKSIAEFYNKPAITTESDETVKILTIDDEYYIKLLARGDFNSDGIEDLLISTEWYARNANGKHVDLVVISKTGKNQPLTANWRLQAFD